MKYAIYQIQCSWKKIDCIYSTLQGKGREINQAHWLASSWSEEDRDRGHKYEVREYK